MNTPAISVIMSVFNAEKYIKESVESILNQTFTDFEFLIFDDCSTDSSIQIIKSFNDRRIKIISNPQNIGLTKTLNKGLAAASGKYIARMDADDIALPERFAKQFQFMELNPEVTLLGTAFKSFGNFTATTIYSTEHNEIRWKQLYECHMLHPSVMIRRDFLTKNNLWYDESFPQAQDYDFWARISQVGKLANLPEVLMHYRQCNDNVTHTKSGGQNAGIKRVRQYLFSKLGVKQISDAELNIFKKTAYHEYGVGEVYLLALKSLLEKIYAASNTSGYFEHDFIAKKLYSMWFHACYNNIIHCSESREIFLSSEISTLQGDSRGKTKFLLKKIVGRLL